MFTDDLAAAPIAAYLDLQQQSSATDQALCFGETGVEICLERLQDAVGAALTGGGQQLVEVGVAKAAHGLAAEVQTAGDGADRPAFLQQAVDVLVAVAGAFDDLGAGQFRGWYSIGSSSGTSRDARERVVTAQVHPGG